MAFDKHETFTLTMPQSHRQATVYYETQDGDADPLNAFGAAVAGEDYLPVTGVLQIPAGATTATFTVPVRAADPMRRRCRVAVKLRPGNGAKVETPLVHAVVLGWVGLLDRIGVVGSDTTLVEPGKVTITDAARQVIPPIDITGGGIGSFTIGVSTI